MNNSLTDLGWDKTYRQKRHLSIWPWSDLVSFVMRYAKPNTSNFRVLELGCGAGANIPFFVSLGVDYFSVEFSETIVSSLHKRFPQFEDTIVVGDFTKTLPVGKFDLIVDRAAVVCNRTEAIKLCLENCYEQLNPNGKFIGIDWYSTKCSAFQQSQKEDAWTRTNFPPGPFAGSGARYHFSDKEHLIELFSRFTINVLEHKSVVDELQTEQSVFASWNFVAEKNE